MLKHLLLHSFRSYKRQRAYIFINILGLSIGIACSLVIALYVINESGYEKFNVKRDRIFRLILNGKLGGQELIGAFTPAPMAETMGREFPEVESTLRINGWGPTVVEYNNQKFKEDHVMEADSTFFDFFSIPVLKGDVRNLLNAPYKVVVTESTARKMFGSENPIDKTIRLGDDTVKYVVSGVMSDFPSNTHFEANYLISFMTNPYSRNKIWLNNNLETYLLLKPNTNYRSVDAKIPELLKKYVGPEVEKYMGINLEEYLAKGNTYNYYLQKLGKMHLDPVVQQQFKPATDPKYLIIFGTIAVLIVIIASINFMNLSTAQAARRAKEVGIKKVGGSSRGILVTQFLSESVMLAFAALIIAVIIAVLCLPYVNTLLGTHLAMTQMKIYYLVPALLLFAVIVGILSGLYPAIFLSSFSPYEVLKGDLKNSMSSGRLRKILVVFQFFISILLIVGTLVMYNQIRYMLNKDVGFNKQNLIIIERMSELGGKAKAFKEAIKQIPGVINASLSTAAPNRVNNNNGYGMEGRKDDSFLMVTNYVDYDYIATYEMKVQAGRSFNESFSTDKEACLVNESVMSKFNISDIEKTRFILPSLNGNAKYLQVIGVIRNFNFESLRNPIRPYIYLMRPDDYRFGYVTVRLPSTNYSGVIKEIEAKWKEYAANAPLQYYFLDRDMETMYTQEKQNAHMAVIFAILAIFIAALGLFGLTSFTVEQKTKEIGVRKAMGSSVLGIYTVISREVFILVSVAAIIAWPVIYYLAGKWLENFYYRISLSVLTFILGLLISLGIAVITITWKIMRAALVNPAQSLKYE
ncbi:MAG TPA: ABC transporter permease [Bacteroidales bacterium]|nr:ABC transporter permease [Bacteroidales bacterium]